MEIVRKRKKIESYWAYLFIGPQMMGLVLFTIGPVLFAFWISFMNWDIGSEPRWVGFENYVRNLSDPLFWKVLSTTFLFAFMNIPITLCGALILALMLNQRVFAQTAFRTIYFMPVITSSVAVALVWNWMYNSDYGLINTLLSEIGIQGPGWLTDTRWALSSIVLMTVWQGLGYNMILFLAALQGVPSQLIEAAKIDGAGAWMRFWKVTLPMITPTLFFTLIISLIGAMQVFNEPFVMTRGGPADATNVIVLQIYNTAFQFFKMGDASAMSFLLFIIILIFTVFQFRFSKWVNYDV